MKMGLSSLVTCAASALLIGAGFASSGLAADVMPTKEPAAAVERLQLWWYEGFAESAAALSLTIPDRLNSGHVLRSMVPATRRVR